MATRGLIGIQLADKPDEVRYIFLHWDASDEEAGKTLRGYYDNYAKALDLVDAGSLSELAVVQRDCVLMKESYEIRKPVTCTEAEYREGGVTWGGVENLFLYRAHFGWETIKVELKSEEGSVMEDKREVLTTKELLGALTFAASFAGVKDNRQWLNGVCIDCIVEDDPLCALAVEYTACRRLHATNGCVYGKVDVMFNPFKAEGELPWRVSIPTESVKSIIDALKPHSKQVYGKDTLAYLSVVRSDEGSDTLSVVIDDVVHRVNIPVVIVQNLPAEGANRAGLPDISSLFRDVPDNGIQAEGQRYQHLDCALMEQTFKAFRTLIGKTKRVCITSGDNCAWVSDAPDKATNAHSSGRRDAGIAGALVKIMSMA